MVNWDMVSHDRDGMKQRGGQPHTQSSNLAPHCAELNDLPAKNVPQE
jgi:hypothetical protein